jgi:hypothetical protein
MIASSVGTVCRPSMTAKWSAPSPTTRETS